MTHPDVEVVGAEIGRHLAEIATLFKPGVRLTLLARGDRADGSRDMVLTDDDLSAAIRALENRRDGAANRNATATQPENTNAPREGGASEVHTTTGVTA